MNIRTAVFCALAACLCTESSAAQMMYDPTREHTEDMKNIQRLEGPLIVKKTPLEERYRKSRQVDYTRKNREKVPVGEVPSYQKDQDYFADQRPSAQQPTTTQAQIDAINEENLAISKEWRIEMQRKARAEEAALEIGRRATTKQQMEIALFSSIYANDIETVRKALAFGVDPNILFKNEYTPLHYAALLRRLDIIMLLLEQPGVHIGTPENQYFTLLYWGAYENHLTLVDKLLKLGANPDIKDDRGFTPWQYARAQKHEAMAKLLREYMKKPL